MESLMSRYRPKKMADVLGQQEVTRALSLFVQEPYSCAMVFHGESGVGKTATAQALAYELGCQVEQAELGGLHEIRSGEMRVERVEAIFQLLRLRPLFGSGWKILICNEADRMGLPVETLWLDALEKLPPRTVVIFTTNAISRLSRRFRDRCEAYHFSSDTEVLKPHIRDLAERVWAAEGCGGEIPGIEDLGMPTLGDMDSMHASFRLALQQLGRYVRECKQGGEQRLQHVRQQLAKDCLVFGDKDRIEAECDFCHHVQVVKAGREQHRCTRCGQTFALELV